MANENVWQSTIASPNKYSLFNFPLNQAGNNTVIPLDYSSNLVAPIYGGSVALSEPWSNAGYLTISAGAGHNVQIPNSKSSWNLNKDSVLILFTVNKALPAANDTFIGNCDATAASGNYGFFLVAITTGKMRVRINADSFFSGMADSIGTFFDGTDHHCALSLNGVTKEVRLYRDGILDTAYASAFTAATYNAITNALYVGQTMTGNGVALEIKGLQMLKFPNSALPINLDEIVKISASKTRTGISTADAVFM
jgi:hypothetical protein